MLEYVFVFIGEGSSIPSGIFSEFGKSKDWIRKNSLSGSLNKLPVDISLYDWAISKNYFEPKRDNQKGSLFIQRFSSASIEHWHFENGMEK
ncbi:DUF7710 domain-containing protein [Arcticibacterium luteifluviistationis]|uniref:DUF7710 domain-containing protein n=1 Tax=Arcticibacterium luteifluviistationis TaxID=1784714 RepID=A0A2Z4G9H0_9BACT|nr:hypothetical protein DJ013_06670 [Arcticibacterium luteifluviistationis]